MKRNTQRTRPRRPRQLWYIKPFDRIHQSKKVYDRRRLKRELRRELEELNV
jgi:hypothetical protein